MAIAMSDGQEKFIASAGQSPRFLDITGELCPLTFVHTKLLIEAAAPGEILEIRLNAGEPLVNVPRSVEAHGHCILSLAPEDPDRPDGVHRLRIQKS
jgi:TusA-related sulfurtransferase